MPVTTPLFEANRMLRRAAGTINTVADGWSVRIEERQKKRIPAGRPPHGDQPPR